MARTYTGDHIEWEFTPTQLASNVLGHKERLLKAILDLARVFAARIQSWARKNAVWTDRTSNARQGLFARAVPLAAGVAIVLFHTVDYGIWLEIANAGRFAIIMWALQAHYGPLMAALRALVRG